VSTDDFDRKMEFIVAQQAQFAADIQVLKERQTAFQHELENMAGTANMALEIVTKAAEVSLRATERLDRHDELFGRLGEMSLRLGERADKTDERFGLLGERDRKTDERFELLGERIAEVSETVRGLAEAQKGTDAKLDRLAEIVERHAGNGHDHP
jgi:hypothetical protein